MSYGAASSQPEPQGRLAYKWKVLISVTSPVLVFPANRNPAFAVILVFSERDFCAMKLSQ